MIFDKIKSLCRERGTSVTALCKEITGSSGNLPTWKKNNIRTEHLKMISERLDVSINYLLEVENEGESRSSAAEEWLAKNAIPVGEMNLLPVYGDVSAGSGAFAEENIIDYEYADARYGEDGHFFLRVSGDSMEPYIRNKDYILVRKQSSVDSGDIAVIVVDNLEGFVKKVEYGKSYIELISFNDAYETQLFEGREMLKVNIIGKVIESKTKW